MNQRYLGQGLNNMMLDLGLSPNDLNNDEIVRKKIEEVESDFDLVMISEKMDESLVLLADLLCIPLEQVAVFPKNARKDDVKQKINEAQRNVLKETQMADETLYGHFKFKLSKQIEAFGTLRMAKQVAELRAIRSALEDICIVSNNSTELRRRYKPLTDDVEAFVVNEELEECIWMGLNEKVFVDTLRKRQKQRLSDIHC